MATGRIPRQRRLRCSLRCQVLGPRRKPIEARVVGLSQGGLSLVGPMDVEKGDPIRIRILHHRGAAAVDLTGIVWSDEPTRDESLEAGFRAVGCLVSDPPAAFLRLLLEIERRGAPAPVRRIPAIPARPRETDCEQDLPRTRELGPPPKPEPEELLPTFRIRLKQTGGPRTRSLAIRARSVTEAESLAREQLRALVDSSPSWELIEVVLAG